MAAVAGAPPSTPGGATHGAGSRADQLTPRQRECLFLFWSRQATSKEIARDLNLSKYTVDKHMEAAVAVLGARSRREAAHLAFGHPPIESGGDPITMFKRPERQTWLPLRTGAHNDLSIAARLVWILVLAVLAAIGFGALASTAQLLSNIFR